MGRYRIGRGDTNDIVLAGETVSREHAELVELGGGRFRIKDLGSTSGISVWQGQDWQKVTDVEIRHDTQLRLGEHQTTAADLLRETDRTIVRARSAPEATAPSAPGPVSPPWDETMAPQRPMPRPAPEPLPPLSDETMPPQRPAPPKAAPQAAPRPAPPRAPAPPRMESPTEAGTLPPQPPPPAFQFLRNLPPEKRILLWLGVGFAGLLLVSLITLILALAL